jgi:hypothetical protein
VKDIRLKEKFDAEIGKVDDLILSSRYPGTTNFVFAKAGEVTVAKCWDGGKQESVDSELETCFDVLVYDDSFGAARILVFDPCQMGVKVFGKGRDTGLAVFMQDSKGVITVCAISDSAEESQDLKVTATDDVEMVDIIFNIIKKLAPEAEHSPEFKKFLDKVVREDAETD